MPCPLGQHSSGQIQKPSTRVRFLEIGRATQRLQAGGRARCCRCRFCRPRTERAVFANRQKVDFKQGESFSYKRFVRAPIISLTNSLICLSFKPSWRRNCPKAQQGCRPTSGSTVHFEDFFRKAGSNFFDFHAACGRAMNVMREVEQSTTAPKYSSV